MTRSYEWSPAELSILRNNYALGSRVVRDELVAAGYSRRSVNAVNRKAFDLGLVVGVPMSPVKAWTAAARVVRECQGLPVTVDDVSDMTGMSRVRSRRMLDLLVAGGVIGSRLVEGNVTVWFDLAAERAA